MRYSILFLLLIFCGQISRAQNAAHMNIESRLIGLADTFLYSEIDEQRVEANSKFIPMLVNLLKEQGSFHNPLDSLARKINVIYSEDRSFRIFNWEVKHNELITRYYGAIQMASSTDLQMFPLVDYSDELLDHPEDSVLTGGKWFGGLIYKIIDIMLPDGNKAYLTLSYNGSSRMTNRKVMDVLYFFQKQAVWGIPFIVDNEGNGHMRFILEYNKNAKATLNYNPESHEIYFDKLVSEINNNQLKYTLIPMGDYAGYSWNGKFWKYVPNVISVVDYGDGNAPFDKVDKKKEMNLYRR